MVRFFYRRRGRYYRLRYRRGRFSRRRISSRKYVNGSTRSTIRMKTSLDLATSVNLTTAAPQNTPVKYVALSAGQANNSLALCASALFRQYAALYDEMKIIGMKVTIAVATPVGTPALPSIQIHTAWDRHAHYGEAAPTIADLNNAATYTTATALNNNVAKITRSIYASDLMEKAMMFQSHVNAGPPYSIPSWEAAGANFLPFSPAFIWSVKCPQLPADVTVNFNMSVVYYVGFRSPRYGGAGGRASLSYIGGLPLPDGGGDDDDMDAPGDAEFPDGATASAAAAAPILIDDPGDADFSSPQPVSRRQLSANSSRIASVHAPPTTRQRKNP